MGMSSMATVGHALRQAPSVPVIDLGYCSKALFNPCFLRSSYSFSQGIMVWAPYTTTNGEWIASKVLQGFFGAPAESLCEVTVTDIVSAELKHSLRSSTKSLVTTVVCA